MLIETVCLLSSLICILFFTITAIKKDKILSTIFLVSYIFFWGLLCYLSYIDYIYYIYVKESIAISNNLAKSRVVNNNINNPTGKATKEDEKKSNFGKIVGNTESMIYHVPGSTYYDSAIKKETNNVYFDTVDEAIKAGYRAPKR